MSELVCIETYGSDAEAEMARVLLENNGIKAMVSGYDSAELNLDWSSGVRLMVSAEDAERAAEILDEVGGGGEES